MKTSCLRRGGNLYNMYSIRYVKPCGLHSWHGNKHLKKINTICVHVIRSHAPIEGQHPNVQHGIYMSLPTSSPGCGRPLRITL